jgi:hypothetical protein
VIKLDGTWIPAEAQRSANIALAAVALSVNCGRSTFLAQPAAPAAARVAGMVQITRERRLIWKRRGRLLANGCEKGPCRQA